MTDVHHLILSQTEIDTLNAACSTVGGLWHLAKAAGIDADKLGDQAQLLSDIVWRLRSSQPATLDKEPASR